MGLGAWLHPRLWICVTALIANAADAFLTRKVTPLASKWYSTAEVTDERRLPNYIMMTSAADSAAAGMYTGVKNGENLLETEWSLDEVIEAVFSKALVNVDLLMNFTLSSPEGIAAQDLFQECQSNVKVGPSTIEGAGRGLFAARDLAAGSIINWYPIHALCLRDVQGEWKIVNDVVKDATYNFNESTYALFLLGDRPLLGWDVQKELSERQTNNSSGSEHTNAPGPGALYVDANPRRKGVEQNLAFQAYLINDGAKIEANTSSAIDEYYRVAWERLNVVFLPLGPAPMLAAVTTTNVAAGEELFTMYGRSYWMGQFSKDESQWADNSDKAREVEEAMGAGMAALTMHAQKVYANELVELEEFFDGL